MCPNPQCGKVFMTREEIVGKRIKCPYCQNVFLAKKEGENPLMPNQTFSAPTAISVFKKENLGIIVRYAIFIFACVIAQFFIQFLPGTDIIIWKTTLGNWINIGLSVVIFLVLICLLIPLKQTATYYLGLVFRKGKLFSQKPELQIAVSSVSMNLILLVFIAVIYWSILPSILSSLRILFGFNPTLFKFIKLGVTIVGIIFLIKIILSLRPLFRDWSESITNRATTLTEKMASTSCPSCGTKNNLEAKFCSSCGKPI